MAIRFLTKLLKSQELHQSALETVANETENIGLDRKVPIERQISPEKRQQIIDLIELRLMW